MRRLLFLFILLSGLTLPALSQGLSLDDAVRIARDSAVAAQVSRNALLRSRWDYEAFLASRRPQLSFEAEPGYQKFSNEPNLHYYKLRNYNMLNTYGGLQFETPALAFGGNFYANSSALWTTYFGPEAAAGVFSTIPLGIGYSNELIGYNPYRWDKRLRDSRMATQEREYRYQLASIACEAEGLFIDCLVATSHYAICQQNCEVTAEAFAIGKERFAIASIGKNELFALELQKLNADNVLVDAANTLSTSRERLFSFLRLEDTGQPLLLPTTPSMRVIAYEEALDAARENNPAYRNAREEVMVAEQQAEKTRLQNAFMQSSVDVNVGVQSNMGYGSQRSFAVGSVTLSIPIMDGGLAKSRKHVAEYDLRYAESQVEESERSLELEVRTLLDDFNTQQDLLLRTSDAIQLADESFAMARELYAGGDIDINTFILALQRKDDAYQNYLQSLQAYWDSWYALAKLCLFED